MSVLDGMDVSSGLLRINPLNFIGDGIDLQVRKLETTTVKNTSIISFANEFLSLIRKGILRVP